MVQNVGDKCTKYFNQDEAKETLRGIYDKGAPIVSRKYRYRSGAVYNGQWIGGIRHGQGTMVWLDSARYEGQWDYNQASGSGKFIHVDGDIYEGKWLNNQANGFGVYTRMNGARYSGNWKNDL